MSLFAASGVKLLQEEDGTRASLHFHTEPSPAPSHSDDASEVPAAATAEKCSAVESTADSLTAQCLSAVVPSAAAAAAVAARRHQHQFAGPDTDGEEALPDPAFLISYHTCSSARARTHNSGLSP